MHRHGHRGEEPFVEHRGCPGGPRPQARRPRRSPPSGPAGGTRPGQDASARRDPQQRTLRDARSGRRGSGGERAGAGTPLARTTPGDSSRTSAAADPRGPRIPSFPGRSRPGGSAARTPAHHQPADPAAAPSPARRGSRRRGLGISSHRPACSRASGANRAVRTDRTVGAVRAVGAACLDPGRAPPRGAATGPARRVGRSRRCCPVPPGAFPGARRGTSRTSRGSPPTDPDESGWPGHPAASRPPFTVGQADPAASRPPFIVGPAHPAPAWTWPERRRTAPNRDRPTGWCRRYGAPSGPRWRCRPTGCRPGSRRRLWWPPGRRRSWWWWRRLRRPRSRWRPWWRPSWRPRRWQAWWLRRPRPPAATTSQAPAAQLRRARGTGAHPLHALERAGSRGRGHHRARLDRPRGRPEAQPFGGRCRPLPVAAGRDGHRDHVAGGRQHRAVRR